MTDIDGTDVFQERFDRDRETARAGVKAAFAAHDLGVTIPTVEEPTDPLTVAYEDFQESDRYEEALVAVRETKVDDVDAGPFLKRDISLLEVIGHAVADVAAEGIIRGFEAGFDYGRNRPLAEEDEIIVRIKISREYEPPNGEGSEPGGWFARVDGAEVIASSLTPDIIALAAPYASELDYDDHVQDAVSKHISKLEETP